MEFNTPENAGKKNKQKLMNHKFPIHPEPEKAEPAIQLNPIHKTRHFPSFSQAFPAPKQKKKKEKVTYPEDQRPQRENGAQRNAKGVKENEGKGDVGR